MAKSNNNYGKKTSKKEHFEYGCNGNSRHCTMCSTIVWWFIYH